MAPKRCVICRGPIAGYGHNAQPLKRGRCCDRCNLVVVQRRLELMDKRAYRGVDKS